MTVTEQVAKFLSANKGRGYCDHCLSIRLRLRRPQEALAAATELAAADGFLRADAHCAVCGGMKKVTWAK